MAPELVQTPPPLTFDSDVTDPIVCLAFEVDRLIPGAEVAFKRIGRIENRVYRQRFQYSLLVGGKSVYVDGFFLASDTPEGLLEEIHSRIPEVA